MQIVYKTVESKLKPLEIDITSSPNSVYIRRNIKEVVTVDDSGNEITKFVYQEACLNKSEYESYSEDLLVGKFNGEDNTEEYQAYKEKLNTGVLYSNGKYYKPVWADLYNKKVNEIMGMISNYEKLGGDVGGFYNTKILITDATNKAENFVFMTAKEVIELWFFLLGKQEEYFNEYKQSLNLKE